MSLTPRDVERGPVDEEGRLSDFAPSWTTRDLVLDPWSGLSHKSIVGPGSRHGNVGPSLAPSWVGRHARRLNAYRVLQAYLSNVSRAFLPFGRDAAEVHKFREYGDAATLRDLIRASVVGEGAEITVDNADSEPEEPDEPVEPAAEATPEEKQAFADAKAKYALDKKRFDEQTVEFNRARDLQEWFDKWAEKEKFPLKLVDCENDAVGLGDGIYHVSWSNKKQRVCLDCYDPGFYFPVLGMNDYDYPERVHLAWEEEDDDPHSDERWVRRITFELVEVEEAGGVTYPYGDDQDDTSSTSNERCLMTDAKWRYRDLSDKRVDEFDPTMSKAVIAENAEGEPLLNYDLGIDFIPLVHVPNTITKHHYGESVLTRVAQILDDIGQNDTDLAVTADLAGAPPLAVKGRANPGKLETYGPGTVFFGDGVDVVDTSHALDALMKRMEALLDRLSVNIRFPSAAMGRVDPSKVQAGVILLLTFAPMRTLMNELRLVRADKYALLYRMVQRLAMVGGAGGVEPKLGGALKPGKVENVELRFGSYMPTDTTALATMLVGLLGAHAVDRASVVRMLSDAGLDLGDDLAEAIERIEHEDFEGATALANALSSEQLAAEYLGRDLPKAPAVAPPGAPVGGAPGTPPAPGAPPAPPAPAPGTPPGAPKPGPPNANG